MPQAQGANAQLIYDVETVYGTSPGTPDVKIYPFISETLSQKRSLIATNIIRASRNMTKPVRGNKDPGGAVKTELNPFMGTLLKHLLGSNTTTGANPYTHTMKVGALPVSLCLEKGFTDLTTPQYLLYNGVRINKGAFEFGSDGYIPFDLDFLAKKETVGASPLDATPTDLGHLPFEGFEASMTEGGSAIAVISKLTLEILNDLDGSNYVIGGTGERRALPAGKSTVSGKLTALFEDVALYNKAVNLTESAIVITLVRGTGLGSAGNEGLVITIPEIVYEQNSPAISGPKGVLVELSYRGFYDNAAEATSLQMVLKNTQVTI